MAVKTGFHSGRAMASVGYGAPSMAAADRNVYIGTILEYSAENMTQEVVVPWNSGTERLRTYEGDNADETVQNYSMGHFMVTVQNRLQANSAVVAKRCEVMVVVSFRNVQVSEVNIFPMTINGFDSKANLMKEAGLTISKPSFYAQGPEIETIEGTKIDDEANRNVVEVGLSETKLPMLRPCKLNLGKKYEYSIVDVHEVARRGVLTNAVLASRTLSYNPTFSSTLSTKTENAWIVVPTNRMTKYFAAWAGHMNYRVVTDDGDNCVVYFQPTVANSIFSQGTLPGTSASILGASELIYTTNRNYFTAVRTEPIMTQTSQTQGNISIPFDSHYNFLSLNINGNEPKRFFGVGVLTVLKNHQGIDVYEKMGDDARLGILRMPARCIYMPMRNTTTAAVANVSLGGLRYKSIPVTG